MVWRSRLFATACMGLALCSPATLYAQSSAASHFTSLRYGYSMTLSPGWVVARGDCGSYAELRSAPLASSVRIVVRTGTVSAATLWRAEETAIAAGGRLQGHMMIGTLQSSSNRFEFAQALIRSHGVESGVVAAGTVLNGHIYMVSVTLANPQGADGERRFAAVRALLTGMTFRKPALPGSFSCTGNGVSKAVATGHPLAHATAVKGTPAQSTATPTFPVLQSQGGAAATASATPTNSATASPTLTAVPTWTATATPQPTATPSVPSATPNPQGPPTSGTTANGCAITPDQAAGELHLLAVLNADRAAAGVPPLTLSAPLADGARAHSCDMALHDTLSHTGSDGSDPFQRIHATGTTYTSAGENIGMAQGYGIIGGIDLLDQQMMAEPGTTGDHHWNIVNASYRQVGLGVINLNGKVWITEDFVG